jgi:hypothetical protein
VKTKASVIGFLSWRQLREFNDLHPTLEDILKDVLFFWPKRVPFVVIDIGRTREEDQALDASGIHAAGPPWRALDFRTTVFGSHHQALADGLADEINTRWCYDPARPTKCVLYVEPHGTGPHGHLQIHPDTCLR